MSVESHGAPRWGDFRVQQLREWFAKSPFYAGSPLLSAAYREADGLYYLRDATGRVCCTMRAEEMRKAAGLG